MGDPIGRRPWGRGRYGDGAPLWVTYYPPGKTRRIWGFQCRCFSFEIFRSRSDPAWPAQGKTSLRVLHIIIYTTFPASSSNVITRLFLR